MRLAEKSLTALRQPSLLRRARLLFFVLAPFAYAVGVWLTLAHDPNTKIGLRLGRSEAIARARDYARQLGVAADGWSAGHRVVADNERYGYYRLHDADRAGSVAALRRLAPEVRYEVALVASDGSDKIVVTLAPDGSPLGFTRSLPLVQDASEQDAARARALADQARAETDEVLRSSSSSSLSLAAAPETDERRTPAGVERTFTYPVSAPDLPGADARLRVTVGGNQITKRQTIFDLDADKAGLRPRGDDFWRNIALACYGILTALLFIYAVFRYYRLTQQREAPHARTIIASVLTASMLILFLYQSEFYLFELPQTPVYAFWIALGFALLGYVVLGAGMGVAYASGEGDVREAYPGKLTSLDALLTGRVVSRNVAQALLAGAALGGWALLTNTLLLLPFADRGGVDQGLAEKSWSFLGGSITGLIVALYPFFGGITLAVFGLLLPLAFLHNRRRLRSPKLFALLLCLLCFVAGLGHMAEGSWSPLAGLVIAALHAATMLAGFFLFDLLAAIMGAAALSLVTWATYLVAQPAGSLRWSGAAALLFAFVVLAIESYYFLRGRTYQEAEVRPLYARHLAERVQMQAEESAAREAQERLMPQTLPAQAGVEVAAVCRPAHTVGGDFYDLFALGENRLGLFVAEGGGGGVGSALTIPFAKGFLMPRVNRETEPADVLCSQQSQLAPLLDEGQNLTVLFAVIDAERRTISYARTGDYPRLALARDGGAARTASDAARTEETRLLPGDAGAEEPCSIRYARLELAAGDAAIFFTDGIAKTLAVSRTQPANLLGDSARPKAALDTLQARLDKVMNRQERRRRRVQLDDDLTAVVVRFTAEDHAAERVAAEVPAANGAGSSVEAVGQV